jgi:hypothetical protein
MTPGYHTADHGQPAGTGATFNLEAQTPSSSTHQVSQQAGFHGYSAGSMSTITMEDYAHAVGLGDTAATQLQPIIPTAVIAEGAKCNSSLPHSVSAQYPTKIAQQALPTGGLWQHLDQTPGVTPSVNSPPTCSTLPVSEALFDKRFEATPGMSTSSILLPGTSRCLLQDSDRSGDPDIYPTVRIVSRRPTPRCWKHGCNGREFATRCSLIRHEERWEGKMRACEPW